MTVKLNQAIRERINDTVAQLISPDSDSDRDRFLKGMIRAFNEVLKVEPIDLEEKEEDEI